MDLARTLVASDGVRLAYWLRPATGGADRLALFLHGAASNHTRFSELVETTRLAGAWALLRPDLRGNGASMTRSGQRIGIWCRDLEEILVHENAPPAVLVGHSLGAQIALHLAHRSPGRVRTLVLVDPVVPEALTGRRARLARMLPLVRFAAGCILTLNRLGMRRRRFPSRDLRRLDEETRAALAGADSFDEIARRYGSLAPILRHMPTANYLRQVAATLSPLPPLDEIPMTALVLLSGDTTFADVDAQRTRLAALPDVRIHTLSANHWPLTETPDEVREALEAWVDDLAV